LKFHIEIFSTDRSSELQLGYLNDTKLLNTCNALQNKYKIIIKKVRFEWDKKKDLANFRNHGVAFDEAKTVFYDENAIEFYDNNHSLKEVRFLMIGLSSKLRILLVSYALMEGKDEDIIRIISSRKATKNEQKIYFERLI